MKAHAVVCALSIAAVCGAAKDFNLTSLSDIYDANQNGYVCAFELRGTRAYSGDPLINLTTFGVSDDRLGKE
jgi:hypothetical protein